MCTAVSQTVFFSSSMQYQMRPPPVTSYCHWGISIPLAVALAKRPRKGCWRLFRRRGSVVMSSHAARTLLGTEALSCSQELATAFLANRQSHPPLRGGGATRSRRRDISQQQEGREHVRHA